MIHLHFVAGSAYRKVYIHHRKISMITPETGFQPMQFDLDNLPKKLNGKELGKENLKLLKEISKLETEEEMKKDVIKDFQSTGWRCIKREVKENQEDADN